MKILLTGTRAPATLDLARRLSAEGAEVIGADSMRYPTGRFSRAFRRHHRLPSPRHHHAVFASALIDLVTSEKVDLLWPTCEEVFHIAKLHEPLSSITRVLAPPMERLIRLHDKLQFARYTQQLGNPVQAPESWSAEGAPCNVHLVWKPCYSRFGSRTLFGTPPSDTKGWMAQEFITGQEFCSFALCVEGQVNVLTFYTAAVRVGKGASCAFVPHWSADAAEFVVAVAKDLHLTGCIAFDFIQRDNGQVMVIECNPRLTSGLHVLEPSVSLVGALARPVAMPPPQRACQLLLPTLLANPRMAGKSTDVMQCKWDPAPVWGQALAVLEFVCKGVAHGISPTAATTYDIEYNGD